MLQELFNVLYAEFGVTIADGTRFLGMDMVHVKPKGILTLHMGTYIGETVKRFESCDTTVGFPNRELMVGMWVLSRP